MIFVHLVIGVALLEFLYFGFAVGRAREKYGVKAPATTGNEMFERYYRVQMNTLEQLIVFIPGIVLFAHYIEPRVAAVVGVFFLIVRAWYFRVRARSKQEDRGIRAVVPARPHPPAGRPDRRRAVPLQVATRRRRNTPAMGSRDRKMMPIVTSPKLSLTMGMLPNK